MPEDKQRFALIYSRGPAWVTGKPLAQQDLAAHRDWLADLHRKGTLVVAGPFTDESGGMAIIDATDEREARATLAADPAIINGVFVAELHAWRLFDYDAEGGSH